MAETPTIADVKSDYKIFQSFSDDHITERINDAIAKAQHDQISDDALAKGIIAWMRHLLYGVDCKFNPNFWTNLSA